MPFTKSTKSKVTKIAKIYEKYKICWNLQDHRQNQQNLGKLRYLGRIRYIINEIEGNYSKGQMKVLDENNPNCDI